MKVFSLPNLVAHTVAITDDVILSSTPNTRPQGQTKEDHSKWSRESTTQGNFISVWEGINPGGRVSASNPVKKIHGIIADYDNADALSKIQSLPSSTSHLPTWVIETFTPGKCRLIWTFENPVLVTNPDLTEPFLKELDHKIKISGALPGFDKASWKDTQYFELGSNWQQVTGAVPIPDSVLSECMLAGGLAAKMEIPDVEIPLDVVAEEVERRWPGIWGGPFTEGAMGPLFWVEPFVNHRSAVVRPEGMVCFSDRAASNFMPWPAILGRAFVEKYETDRAARLAEMFYYDGKEYWTQKSPTEKWMSMNVTEAHRRLRDAKCSPRVPKGSYSSEVDKVTIYIQDNRSVAAAVPMIFQKETLVNYNGNTYLNTSLKKAMDPADSGDPKDFPWIYDFIMNAFDGDQDGIPAREYFIGWFKRFWLTSYQGDLQPGQSIILAGEAHVGKSFIAKWLIGEAVGGSFDAEDLLLSRTKFNKAGAENALWRCDDIISKGDQETKQLLAASLKAMASKPTVLYQPKFVDVTELPFKGRVFLSCNVDPESLKILPYLDGTIKDKLMLFRIAAGYQPHFFNTNSENEGRVLTELPFFLRWLMNYQVNPGVIDPKNPRFDIKSFHHKTLVDEANSEQPESLMAEIIHRVMIMKRGEFKKGEVCKMGATEFAQAIEDAMLGKSLQQLGGIRNMGKMLHKVVEQGLSPHLTAKPKLTKGIAKYIFDPCVEEPGDE